MFGWHIRWQGPAKLGGHSIHVGTDGSYAALYTPPEDLKQASGEGQPNHVGVLVRDLDATETKVRAAGYKPYAHADYEPGRRFYFSRARRRGNRSGELFVTAAGLASRTAGLVRVGALAAILGGALRIVSSFIPYEANSAPLEALYAVIDVCFVFGLIAIYITSAEAVGMAGLAAFLVAMTGLASIVGPDPQAFGIDFYRAGALVFVLGLAGLSVQLFRARLMTVAGVALVDNLEAQPDFIRTAAGISGRRGWRSGPGSSRRAWISCGRELPRRLRPPRDRSALLNELFGKRWS